MNYKEHATAGTVASTITCFTTYYFTLDNLMSLKCALIAFVMSIFPDVDTQSTPSKYFARVGVGASLVLMFVDEYKYAAFIGLSFMWLKMGKHRGWTHSYFLPIVFFVAVYFFPNHGFYFVSAGLGLLTHYFIDGMNPFKTNQWVDFK